MTKRNGYSPNPEQAKQATKDTLAMLHAGIDRLESSEDWQRFLSVAAKFHDYSLGNQLLIALQAPHASRVAGFLRWLELGRHVRKGEKGIRIMAPMVFSSRTKAEDGTETEEEHIVRLFKAVSVFDVSQTDGEDLPTMPISRIGSDAGAALFERLLAHANGRGLRVAFEAFTDPNLNGQYNSSTKTITLREGLSMAHRCKTLAHELGHHYDPRLDVDGLTETGRANREVLAESVAYLVLAAEGIESDCYSFAYIASWTKDRAQRQEILKSAQSIANAILGAISTTEEAAAA
jgi:antirestriction protein ArdC